MESGYAHVNGLRMYYEIHGEGRPLVLIHGALSAIGTSFGKLIPDLARTHQVIALDQQAHGRTADVDRPLRIATMADDTIASLGQLGVGEADFFGYSMGAGVALDLAIRYPQAVDKLVLASVSFNRAGFHPGLLEGLALLTPEHLAGSPWQQEYAQVAPHPDAWATLLAKVKAMNLEIGDWPADAIRSITAPTLIVLGDSDIIRPEHAVEMFRLLGGGVSGDTPQGLPKSRLAILPGTSHTMMVDRAALLLPMLSDFLDG
jgi:pimeloyl-ACP methyl ester carboxylesterase